MSFVEEKNLSTESGKVRKTANLLLLADCQMWCVVQNGRQIDVHAQVIPEGEKARDVTVYSNAPLECANLIVTEHNRSLLARNAYLPNQSEIERLTQERAELSEEMINCHRMLDLELDEYAEGMVSIETLETRLRGYFHGRNYGRTVAD